MHEKDKSEKYLEEYPDVFADILNVLVLEGDYIRADELYNGPTESIYKAENGADINEQRRDISKYLIRNNKIQALFGIENQSAIDKNMAIRIMGYDYSSYRSQIVKGDSNYPVITIVLNFTYKKWKAPLSVKDFLKCPNELGASVSGYNIKVINVAYLPKKIRNRFKSDFKIIADFFTEKRKTGKFTPTNIAIKHEIAVLNMLKIFTGDKRYEEIEYSIKARKEKGEVITMCTFVDEWENKGMQKGLLQGRNEGRIMEAVLIYTEELHLSQNEILKKIIKKFGLKKEDARKYLMQF